MRIIYVQRVEFPRDMVMPNEVQSLAGYYALKQTPENRDKIRAEFRPSLDVLNALIPLDYMGSAEFEWGAIPTSLRRISQTSKFYVKFEHKLQGLPRAGWGFKGKVPTSLKTSAPIYGWCKPDDIEAVKEFLEIEAKGDPDRKYYLKEQSKIQDGCFGVFTYQNIRDGKTSSKTIVEKSRIAGWFDIENDWFVSTNKYQSNQLAYLLGVPVVHD